MLRFAAVSPSSRPRPSATDLPARDFAEIKVAEAVQGDGCPCCNWRSDAERRAIDALIGEAVTDVGVRRRLHASGGYCARHAALLPIRERARRGGTLGSAVLLGSVLAARLAALDAAATNSGRKLRGRLEAVGAPAACPVCRDVEASIGSLLAIIVGRLADPAWAAALGRADLCLADVLLLWTVAAQAGGRTLDCWRPIGTAQAARLREVLAVAESYVAHSGHDRQAELTDVERTATDALVRALGGREPADPEPPHT